MDGVQVISSVDCTGAIVWFEWHLARSGKIAHAGVSKQPFTMFTDTWPDSILYYSGVPTATLLEFEMNLSGDIFIIIGSDRLFLFLYFNLIGHFLPIPNPFCSAKLPFFTKVLTTQIFYLLSYLNTFNVLYLPKNNSKELFVFRNLYSYIKTLT